MFEISHFSPKGPLNKMSDTSPIGRPTIYDVARSAGVSPSLVSLVLRSPSKVSDKRREAVEAAIVELGYRPSRAATALASNRTKSIGLLIEDYRNVWFVDLLRGMQSALSSHGYNVIVADSQPGEGRVMEAADGLLALHVDGLVVAAEPSESMLAGNRVPTVVAGWREAVPGGADLLTNDDEGGGRMAVEHLLGLGHSRIVHLSGSGGAAHHRRSGFRSRVLEAGLEFRLSGEADGTSEEDGYAAACRLLEHHPDTTAIFAANDTMAVGAFAALKARGLRVPDDVSVIGYDNSPLAKSRYLDITSIDNRSDLLGVEVGHRLLARIEDAAIPPERRLIDPLLVVRSTTAPPRSW